MRYGASNQYTGEVTFIRKGEVMSEVVIEVTKGIYVTSAMTTATLSNLGIHEGDRITALVKAENVVLVKE